MSAPYRNRSVSLTLESNLPSNKSTTLITNGAFVSKFLPSSGLVGQALNKKFNPSGGTLTLSGVNSISGALATDTGTDMGVSTWFIQPWYIKPVPITLKGTSYLGTYPSVSVPDRDFERLLKMFKTVANDFSSLYGAQGTKERVLLELNGYPQGAARFLGLLGSLTWDEEVKNANVINWSLTFVGRSTDGYSVMRGKNGAITSAAIANNNVTAGNS